MKVEVDLCLRPEANSVSFVRDLIKSLLSGLGVRIAGVDDVVLALSEACTNVLRHAGSTEDFEVWLAIHGAICQIRVTDTGRGLGPGADSLPMPDPTATGGRGIAIIRAVSDSVGFASKPGSGTTVSIVKLLQFDPPRL